MDSNRRDFIKKTALVSGCLCLGASGLSGCSMSQGLSDTPELSTNAYKVEANQLIVSLKNAPELEQIGGSVKLSIQGNKNEPILKIIIICDEENSYKAFSDSCTHRYKELNFLHDEKVLACSSFGHSHFNLKGEVIKGPAKSPLNKYPLTLNSEILNITI